MHESVEWEKREIKMCNMKRLTFGLICMTARKRVVLQERNSHALYVKSHGRREGKVQQVDEIIVHMRQRSKKAWLIRFSLILCVHGVEILFIRLLLTLFVWREGNLLSKKGGFSLITDELS